VTAAKPPLPTHAYELFPRIPVVQDGSFTKLLNLAVSAANRWTIGPDGPLQRPGMPGADITYTQLREALIHLLELGLIDIDEERMNAAYALPGDRMSFRPADLPGEAK
jgi:hypothetical protein